MIIPAILEKDFETIVREVKAVEGAAKLVQIDVSDGVFTPHKTFTDIKRLDDIDSSADFEIHLMVGNPLEYVTEKIFSVVSVCAHVEAENVGLFMSKSKGMGYKTGLAINPETPITALSPFMKGLDFVQFMGVNPGSQGQQFIPEVLDKIKVFKMTSPDMPVRVDGGIDESMLSAVAAAGVKDVVIGSQIYQTPIDSLKHFEQQMQNVKASREQRNEIKRVAFLGGAGVEKGSEMWEAAYATAELLARAGYMVVNGGGPGVMEASTKGAHAGGGQVLAVTYHTAYKHKNYEGVYVENDFDKEIVTLDYFDRTKAVLQNSDVHVVFKGGTGTISEFGMTWASSRIHEGHHKPIILYGDFWGHIIKEFRTHMLLRPGEVELLKIVSTPQGVLEYIKQLSD